MVQNSSVAKRPSLAVFQSLEVCQNVRPEWLRIPAAVRVSGLSRTQLFALIAEGAIDSRHIKKPGNVEGIRLIRLSSLLNYIDSVPS
jgi:hypothetical protein